MSKHKEWWVRQGYRGDHPVHSSGTEIYERNYADEFEGTVDHIEGQAERHGNVPITYNPTSSSNPGRPRTLAAGYDGLTHTMALVFREGAVYEYYDVTPAEWQRLKRSASPGKFLNRVLPDKNYLRIQ
jgi:hypothetical protein